MHDPIGAFSRIRAFYLSYLDTASRLEGPDIREERRKLLMKTGTLCTSPLLEPLPSWEEDDRSFEDLVNEEGEDAILAGLSPKARRAFVDLIGCGLIGRDKHKKLYHPYTHQIEMLKRGVRDGKAGIVTSGTGSGKTEAFLLPILASIIEEATRDGGWEEPASDYPRYCSMKNRWWRSEEDGQPMAKRNSKGDYELPESELKAIKEGLKWDKYKGLEQRCGENKKRPAAIRALILYPMNALVEDQMTRLRMALDSQDARHILDKHLNRNRIFFGRYTGQTKGGPAYLLEYEKALKNLPDGEEKKKLSDIIEGCDDNRTLNEYKQSVAKSRQNRIKDLIIELSRLDELELAIRKEAKTCGKQVSLSSDKEIQDKAFAFPSLDGAEMITRWDMQEYPPDILVTNITMLNAMLSRKTEACMLEKTREWLERDPRNRFTLVIDELHLQRGSAGTEFMYLLRLLFVRLGLDRPEHHHQLRLLASSASLSIDENNKEASLSYLYDAFSDFGLREGAKKEDWFNAVVPGKAKNSTSKAHLSVSKTELNKAISTLMKTLAPEDNDRILPEPNLKSYHKSFTEFLDALAVPNNLDSLEERWEWLASAVGYEFEKACRRNEDDPSSVVATSLDKIAERCWREHGWSDLEVERNLRLLTYVIGAVDHSGLTGKQLRELREKERWPVPRFRLHTFFRIPQGLFADVVSPSRRSPENRERWQGKLSIERNSTTQKFYDNESYSVRQFELLSCECCGECFIGGVRANEDNNLDDVVAELLPNEDKIESLPDLSISDRFEEYNYDEYIIFWPKDKNNKNFDDADNEETWKSAWLDPGSGIIFDKCKDSEEGLQAGYIFTRSRKNSRRNVTNQSPGSHTPCRCPRCKIDYAPRRQFKNNRQGSLFKFSPIGSQRSGLERTTQLLVSELYDVLVREGDSGKARLVSFSDSRQGAARTALGVEQLHHRDVLREILLEAIISESRHKPLKELQDEIKKLNNAISMYPSDPTVAEPLIKEREKKQILADYQSLEIICLESILELEPPKLEEFARVKPFLTQLINLGIHPFCERGATKIELKEKGEKIFECNWWELFDKSCDKSGNTYFQWFSGDPEIQQKYSKLCQKFLDNVLEKIGKIIFDKTYFALEATGFAYPVPQPPKKLLLKSKISKKNLDRAAAWMRIYTDNYRYHPSPYDSWPCNKIEWEQIEKKRSNIAKLIQSAAKNLNQDCKNLFNNMRELMDDYGHSSSDTDYIRLENIAFRIPKDSDPYWRCDNCRRIHLHRGLGFCTRCGEELPADQTESCTKLQSDNFLGRRLGRSPLLGDHQEDLALGRGVFRLRCEELTGQTIDPASRQREFKGIHLPASSKQNHLLKPEGIEMLSVTTTMEVGIDIGPLEAIMQANMPPQRFNYQQRVGRAGRRGQAFSFVLTLCRSRSHDLHYFCHPEKITGDAPPPPFLVRRLPRIAERLFCKEQLITAFQWIEEKHRGKSKGFWLGDLVTPVDIHGDFIPVDILRNEKKEKNLWHRDLCEAFENPDVQAKAKCTLKAIERGNENKSLSLKSSKELWEEIVKDIERAGNNTIGLGAHLANYGLLPMYGLPTRLRELVLGPGKNNNSPESLSRDLEVAIYEYAPGNTLIHDKRDHCCIGLTPRIDSDFSGNKLKTLSDKPWDRLLQLGKCPKCWAWREINTEEENPLCSSCQNKSPWKDWNFKWCLEPAAFRTDFDPQTKPINSLPGSSSNSLCADSEPPKIKDWKDWKGKVKVQLATSDSTTVYRLNQGPKKHGFNLDWKNGCQYSRSGRRSESLKAQAIDRNLLELDEVKRFFSDAAADALPEEIKSKLKKSVYLAAPRVTDGLYLLPQEMNPQLAVSFLGDDKDIKIPYEKDNWKVPGKCYWQGVRAAAISASEILILAATRELDIEYRALEAVEPRLFKKEGKRFPLIQIVDQHVNGAGFSDWLGDGNQPPILELLSNILRKQAQEWAEGDHKHNCQEACYLCLKTYDNQNLHGLLDWRLGLAYLQAFTDPDWMCGLDGNFDCPSLDQWPELSKRIRNETLTLWDANEPENKREYPLGERKIYAFRFSSRHPWVIVRHPLWRWGLDEGPLAKFAHELDPTDSYKVLCWDTFNLSRRPGRTRQWMKSQSQRRPRRRRKC